MNLLRLRRVYHLFILRGLVLVFSICILGNQNAFSFDGQPDPVRIAIAGLVHGHVDSFLDLLGDSKSVDLVGVYERSNALLNKYGSRYRLGANKKFSDLTSMLSETQPDVVVVFSNTFDHLEIVETAAPLGIDVVLEKPLSYNLEHAQRIERLAQQHDINLLVNFVSTWFSSNQAIYDYVKRKELIGPIRKMVSRYGHSGPAEIGVSKEFLEWLVDPSQSGGGALVDFACYGANLMTWMMGNRRPISVTAITQRFKSDEVYSQVEDEATILLEYEDAQGIIQASWNYPVTSAGFEVYGTTGYAKAVDQSDVILRMDEAIPETLIDTESSKPPYNHILDHLVAVVRDNMDAHQTLSLRTNVIVSEILEAAKESARTRTKVYLKGTEG